MSVPGNSVWQVNATGAFEALKAWADARQDGDDPSWLSLSVFEEKLPEGRLQLLFAEQRTARQFVKTWTLDAGFNLDCQPLEDENWIAKSLHGLPVVRAGRFFIHGAHHDKPDDSAIIAITIEAGEAFGTGHHGTTKGCLLAFDEVLKQSAPGTVLDLGTGAGTLAIGAAKALPNVKILATDIDPIAIDVARSNGAINAVAARIEFVVADGFCHEALKGKCFDLVFANILANPLIALAGDITVALGPFATLILSGILDTQAARVRDAYEIQGLEFVREYALDEWRVLVMKRPA